MILNSFIINFGKTKNQLIYNEPIINENGRNVLNLSLFGNNFLKNNIFFQNFSQINIRLLN